MADGNFEGIARALIAAGESFYVEFKGAYGYSPEKQARDIKDVAADIAETVVAFANADGGDLLVGVEDRGTVTGLPFDSDRRAYLSEVPKTRVKPPHLGVTVHELSLEGQPVLLFRVPAYESEPVVTSDGKCLLRKGAANDPVEPGRISRRREDIRGLRYEVEPVPQATIEDLDLGRLTPRPAARVPELTPLDLLRYWNLFEGRNGTVVFRRAALLLFAKDPLRWHPNNRVRIRFVRSAGFGGALGTREVEVTGPASVLIAETLRRLRPELEREARQEELFSTTSLLPREAVDECVVNAVAHRNYAIEGSAIEVLLHADKVEFRSPGTLLEPLTLDDLRRQAGAHRARNPVIMRVLRDLGWTRDQGEGMQRIFGSMRQVELHEPELDVEADTFVVRLSTRSVHDEVTRAWIAAYGPSGLLPQERKYVLALRGAGGELSIDKLARRLNESYDQTKKAADALERKGIAWHAKRSRLFHLVEPLNVPFERALRRINRLKLPLDGTTAIEAVQLGKLVDAADERSARAAAARLVEAGVLAPFGRGYRLAPQILAYSRARGS